MGSEQNRQGVIRNVWALVVEVVAGQIEGKATVEITAKIPRVIPPRSLASWHEYEIILAVRRRPSLGLATVGTGRRSVFEVLPL